jgi:hypothetical protein
MACFDVARNGHRLIAVEVSCNTRQPSRMKTFGSVLSVIMVVAMSAIGSAQESRPATSPQPRIRLDPVTRAAIPEPVKVNRAESRDVVQLSPFVVKSTPLLFTGPEQEPRPTGPFSLLSGGWLVRKKVGSFDVQVGAWPYENIFWKADSFLFERKHVVTEFVRISW